MLILKRWPASAMQPDAEDRAWIDIYDGGRLVGSVCVMDAKRSPDGANAYLGFKGFDGLKIVRRELGLMTVKELRKGKEAPNATSS